MAEFSKVEHHLLYERVACAGNFHHGVLRLLYKKKREPDKNVAVGAKKTHKSMCVSPLCILEV